MPANTVNFNLPYPTGTDAPCDFAEQWCDFTDAIEAVLGTFQAGIDRAIPVVPAVLVRTLLTHNIANGQKIPFNEVVLDTAAMSDLDADPYSITIQRPGRYTLAAYLEKGTSTVANSQLTLFIDANMAPLGGNDPINGSWTILDRGVALTYSLPAYSAVSSLQAGTKISTFFNAALPGLNTITMAWLCAFWHSDNEAAT